MQTPSSNPKKNSARRRSADPHARLSARLRHISFGAAVLLVVVAALTVIYSLYKIQIRDGATYRQYAAEQQLLDSTIQATRGEIYDTSGITLASTSGSGPSGPTPLTARPCIPPPPIRTPRQRSAPSMRLP